ncbi:TolC family protein [Anaerotignum lactatifermentans]|uniref:TolC family protein n=1 Tax=Anaerotignum lactatifermentans TaxID=160404 RepID=A0ABS2G9P2_9FIRM|nr:TolC family protein [Anaerotignum lactatifermentans]MBM6829061.1 TolC family protein [Anaerotignum lactatifermentans]MBM6877332.1 TolC family protein [Anaerotignum lactatifermentans]MBM6950703.1 TolC family protein [Anaerotignum lactatifermentans]
MKYSLHKGKTVALALAAVLCLPATAFAAEDPMAGIKVIYSPSPEETAEPLPELTFEQALEKAEKKSPDLRSLADYGEFLQATKEDLWDKTGFFSVPDASYRQWISDYVYSYYSASQSTDSGMKQNAINTSMTKLALESTVKNYFTTILSDESNLEAAKEAAKVQDTSYEQGKLKNELGLMSDYQLEQLRIQTEQANNSVALLEYTLEQEYQKFNSLMGEDSEARFDLVYDVEYAPYELHGTMEQHINNKLNSDYTVLLKEQAVKDAEFKNNYLPASSDGSEAKQLQLNLDNANRDLKTTKENKELAIRNAYSTILQLETNYDNAQASLTQAQADYRVAQINLQAGNVTQLSVDQAALAVAKAQNELNQVVYNHDMQIYLFENTSLLGSAS